MTSLLLELLYILYTIRIHSPSTAGTPVLFTSCSEFPNLDLLQVAHKLLKIMVHRYEPCHSKTARFVPHTHTHTHTQTQLNLKLNLWVFPPSFLYFSLEKISGRWNNFSFTHTGTTIALLGFIIPQCSE